MFQIRPLGLFFYDAQSGRAQLLAPVQDCVGELVPPNQVVWKSAFGPLADLRLTYTKSAIESDVMLRQQPALPDGWDPQTTRLEVWHEQIGCPAPGLKARLLHSEEDPALRSQMIEPDFTDQMLDFGDLWFPTGADYATDGAGAPARGAARTVEVPDGGGATGRVPVAKTWLTTPSENVLVEAVRWPDVQPLIGGLPEATEPLPAVFAVPFEKEDRLACLSRLAAPHPAPQLGLAIKVSAEGYNPVACVLDFIGVPSSYGSPYTFATYTGGNTYYVTNTTYFSSTVTFSPGCVIKFNTGAYLLISGAIVCNGTAANPSILTTPDDLLFGERTLPVTYSCPTYTASRAIRSYYLKASVTLSHLRIRWAQTGVEFDADDCDSYTHTFADSSLEFCQTGIYSNGAKLTISNSTRCGVTTPTSSYDGCSPVTGSLTEIGTGDADNNGVVDSDDYKYFGRLGTLQGHEVGRLTARISGHNVDSDQRIWYPRDDATAYYVFNPNCWLAGVQGLTAFSPWHSTWWVEIPSGSGNWFLVNTYDGAATLITRRHAVTAGHMAFPAGTHVRFAGTDGTHEVICLQSQSVAGFTDLAVMVFDQDLPPTVGSVPVLPPNVTHKLAPTINPGNALYGSACKSGAAPFVACNNRKEAFICDAYMWTTGESVINRHSMWFDGWGSWCYRNGQSCGCYSQFGANDQTNGDSGSPNFLLINNQLVLVGPWWNDTRTTFVGASINNVNNAITALDASVNHLTGYTVSVFDISSFPDLW